MSVNKWRRQFYLIIRCEGRESAKYKVQIEVRRAKYDVQIEVQIKAGWRAVMAGGFGCVRDRSGKPGAGRDTGGARTWSG
jgi:hypothetical protein